MSPSIFGQNTTRKDTVILSLIIALSVVFVCFLIVLGLFISDRIRHRRYRQLSQRGPTPDLEQSASPKQKKHSRKASLADRIEEEESQREFMIRKSYASRTSTRADSQLSKRSEETTDVGSALSATASMRDDWKEWEASLQMERSMSPQRHPSLASLGSSISRPGMPPPIPEEQHPLARLDPKPAFLQKAPRSFTA